MNRLKLAFMPVIACIGIALYLATQAGGRHVPLFLLLLALFSLYYYFGFVHKRDAFSVRHRNQLGAVLFFLLAIMMVWFLRQELNWQAEIGKFITPYSTIDDVVYLPPTGPDILQHWWLKTPDSVEAVSNFYTQKANLADWTVQSPPPALLLSRDNQSLSIYISRNSENDLTDIIYRLESRR